MLFLHCDCSKTNGAIRVNFYDDPLIRVFAVKAFWLGWRVFAPLFLFHVPLTEFLIGFILTELSSGWYLAFNFQVRLCCRDWQDWVEHAG